MCAQAEKYIQLSLLGLTKRMYTKTAKQTQVAVFPVRHIAVHSQHVIVGLELIE